MKISVGRWRGGVQGAWSPECDSIPHVRSNKAGQTYRELLSPT